MISSQHGFELDWGHSDPNLRGPYHEPDASTHTPFAISGAASKEITFARIRSGPAYPACLNPIDRLVPLPGLADVELPDTAEASVVLSFLDEHGDWRRLCTTAPGVVHWRLDPQRWILTLLDEAYVAHWTRPLTSRIPLLNYARAPGRLKGTLQRSMSAAAERPEINFPTPPLDDFADSLRRLCAALCWGQPPQMGELWPGGCRAAVTITHDVDVGWIWLERNRETFRQILDAETSRGFRGGWFIPAAFYHPQRHDAAIRELEAAGHELGAHGWNHDTKLAYRSARRQQHRLERITDRISPRRPAGIRTPWYSRNPQLFEQLADHFRYDSSVPNASAGFSTGSNSGCCTVFPYRVSNGLMELPLTLPPDDIRDPAAGYALARDATEGIVERGGVVVVILHPQPHQSANAEGIAQFTAFLQWLRSTHGESLWSATPADIVEHYCRRTGLTPYPTP